MNSQKIDTEKLLTAYEGMQIMLAEKTKRIAELEARLAKYETQAQPEQPKQVEEKPKAKASQAFNMKRIDDATKIGENDYYEVYQSAPTAYIFMSKLSGRIATVSKRPNGKFETQRVYIDGICVTGDKVAKTRKTAANAAKKFSK